MPGSSSGLFPHVSGPNILLSPISSNTLRLRYSLNISDHVSQPYKTTGKIIVLRATVNWLNRHRRSERTSSWIITYYGGVRIKLLWNVGKYTTWRHIQEGRYLHSDRRYIDEPHFMVFKEKRTLEVCYSLYSRIWFGCKS
jgi:hypothetical protein